MGLQAPLTSPSERKLPLVVDLDGTLVKTDCLVECLLHVVKARPWVALQLPFWMLKGKAAFKHEVMRRTHLDPARLPYHESFVAYLRAEHAAGREIILATASTRKVAASIADHVGIFSDVLASDKGLNLSGSAKALALLKRYGEHGYVYAGNAAVDRAVWRHAAAAIFVEVPAWVKAFVSERTPVEARFEEKRSLPRLLLKATRVHQWTKNLLVFAPLLLSGHVTDWRLVLQALLGFAAFSLVASSVYLVNDLLDLDADRLHPDNRRRPFASGELSLVWGAFLSPGLLAAGMAMATLVSPEFLVTICTYFALTCAYSFKLKQIVLADILILAGLYALRVHAGAVATATELSAWFLIFSGFLFLSLALLKRCSELLLMERHKKKKNLRRGYTVADLAQLTQFGTATGYLSVLTFALYLKSSELPSTYAYPKLLWLVCPLLLYWISRMWLEAHRGHMHTDPLVFTLRDRTSHGIIAAIGIIWFLATGMIQGAL